MSHSVFVVGNPMTPSLRQGESSDPLRPRRLLLHRREISELWDAVRQKGVTIVPVRIYLKEGRAKLEIAIARGTKLHDKREAIARRDAERVISVGQQDARAVGIIAG